MRKTLVIYFVMASPCSYCPACNNCQCKANCNNCLKAKQLYKTSWDILHYQENTPKKDKNNKRKNNLPTKRPTEEQTSSSSTPLKSRRLQEKTPDDLIKPEEKNNEDIEDKTFYCYRRMQDLETKCCKQCEKTKLKNNECRY
jgi:hypothetical protein